MTPTAEHDIRRRADGSIDTDFYMRTARQLRAVAINQDTPRWFGLLRSRIASMLAARGSRRATNAPAR